MKIFLSESTLYSCLNVKEFFAWDRRDIWSLSDSNGIPTQIHLVRKRTKKYLAKLANDSSVLWVLICTVHLAVCYYHITYAFQSESKKKKKSESTLYRCLNVKKILAQNRRGISSLSDSNRFRTHYHLVLKRTLNHLAKLVL